MSELLFKNVQRIFKENIENYYIDYISEEAAVPFSFMYSFEMNKKLHYMKKGKQG